MKIVFIGEVDFSYHCLETVIKNKGDIVGIVTSAGSKINSDYRDLTPLAIENGIPIHYTKDINGIETLDWIKNLKPDIIFCWGISKIIRKDLLTLVPMGIVGVHPALLPSNRGRHPIIWALVLGLRKSGLTFFFMDEGVDSGPILSQKLFDIGDNDDAGIIYDRIKKLAEIQISEFLPQLMAKTYDCTLQDNKIANNWRKRTHADGVIDWRMSTQAVLNLIRALARPYPGAEFVYKGESIKIWKAEKCESFFSYNNEPGKVLGSINGSPVIKCYDGAVVLTEYEPYIKFSEGEYLL